MCGRAYQTFTEEELELRYLNKVRQEQPKFGFLPSYNLAPTQQAPIVYVCNGQVTLTAMRFGFLPSWAKNLKEAARYSLINARGEEISEKPTYRLAFEKRRCIVPLSGFYEWQKLPGGAKRPFAIHLKDEAIASAAGVWELWKNKENGEALQSFSIITTVPNSLMEPIHNRMPVLLNRQDEMAWLDPDQENLESLKALLKPCPTEWLTAYEISTLINSPKNNVKEVLSPIKFTD